MLLRSFFFFFLFLASLSLQGQSKSSFINQKYWGIFVQYGIPYYDLPEKDRYRPLIIGAIHHLPFYQTDKNFNIGVDFMPQIGITRFNSKTSIEFGVNVQFNFNFQLAENHLFSIRTGAGPHYVSVATKRQAKGFIFSDNFALSYRTKLNDQHQFGILTGIRHISNAGLMQPNLGIDNIMLGIEFAKLMQ